MNVIDVDHFYERLDAIDAALREFSRHYPNVTADQPLPFPRAPEALNVDDFCQKYVPSSSDGIVEIEKMPKQKRKQVSDQSPTIQGSQTNSKKRRRSKQLDGLLGRRRNESERKGVSQVISSSKPIRIPTGPPGRKRGVLEVTFDVIDLT